MKTLCILFALIAVGLWAVIPHLSRVSPRAICVHMLANCHCIQRRAEGINNDNPNRLAAWPGDLPVTTTRGYIEYLVKNDYLQEGDLKFFSGPGYPPAHTLAELTDNNIAYTIYRVSAKDSPETLFLVSKQDLLKKTIAVIMTKGGAGRIAADTKALEGFGSLPKTDPKALSLSP